MKANKKFEQFFKKYIERKVIIWWFKEQIIILLWLMTYHNICIDENLILNHNIINTDFFEWKLFGKKFYF